VPIVQVITPDDGQGCCPKHVELRYQNKNFELSATFGFIEKEKKRIFKLSR